MKANAGRRLENTRAEPHSAALSDNDGTSASGADCAQASDAVPAPTCPTSRAVRQKTFAPTDSIRQVFAQNASSSSCGRRLF